MEESQTKSKGRPRKIDDKKEYYKEYNKNYYQENKDRLKDAEIKNMPKKEYFRKYYEENKDKYNHTSQSYEKKKEMLNENKETIINMINSGKTRKSISRETGISEYYIKKLVSG